VRLTSAPRILSLEKESEELKSISL